MNDKILSNAQVALLSAAIFTSGHGDAPIKKYRDEFFKWLELMEDKKDETRGDSG